MWEVCLLTADPSIVELLYGPLEGVSTHKPVVPPPQFTLDHLTTTDKNAERQVYELRLPCCSTLIHTLVMLRLIPVMIVLLFAGCARSPERAALGKANALLDEGRVQAALDTVQDYLRQHPDSAPLLRMRVVVLLRQEQIDLAALALQKLPGGDPILAEILRHRDRIVRENAAKLIAVQPNADNFHEIVRALDDQDPAVRRYCARALGRLGNPSALKPLFQLLSDDNWFVRAEAATALGRIGDDRAVGWLVQLLSDQDGYVRYSATSALHALAKESSRSLLLRTLESAGSADQFWIAVALAKLHDPAVLIPLTNVVQSKDVDVRRLAAEALGECGLAAGTNALAVLIQDPDRSVREQAQAAMGQIHPGSLCWSPKSTSLG